MFLFFLIFSIMGIPVLVIISTLVKIRTKSNIALKPFDIFIKICIKKARSKCLAIIEF